MGSVFHSFLFCFLFLHLIMLICWLPFLLFDLKCCNYFYIFTFESAAKSDFKMFFLFDTYDLLFLWSFMFFICKNDVKILSWHHRFCCNLVCISYKIVKISSCSLGTTVLWWCPDLPTIQPVSYTHLQT